MLDAFCSYSDQLTAKRAQSRFNHAVRLQACCEVSKASERAFGGLRLGRVAARYCATVARRVAPS